MVYGIQLINIHLGISLAPIGQRLCTHIYMCCIFHVQIHVYTSCEGFSDMGINELVHAV